MRHSSEKDGRYSGRKGRTLRLWGAPSFFLILWAIGSHEGIWNPYILPSPMETASALYDMAVDGSLWLHLAASLGRISGGFGMAVAVGIPLGALSALSERAEQLLKIPTEFLRHLPPLGLFPFLMMWFGIGELSKEGVIFLAALFPMYLNTMDGVMSTDPKLKEAAATCGWGDRKILLEVVLPSALPSILTGMKLGLGYGWRSLVGAELIAASSGLGYLLHQAEVFSRADVMTATLFAMGAFGVTLDMTMSEMIKRWGPGWTEI